MRSQYVAICTLAFCLVAPNTRADAELSGLLFHYRNHFSSLELPAVERFDTAGKTLEIESPAGETLLSDVIVVLQPQRANAHAWKRKHPLIKVLSVHRASDDVRIRV